MGMAASQARYLSLTARQSDLEYQAQQINQERSVLSQQCNALYNSLLDIKVPTPPSTNDYTTIKYTGSDNVSSFTVGKILPSTNDSSKFNVEIFTQVSGAVLSQQYNTASVKREEKVQLTGTQKTGDRSTVSLTDITNSYYVITENGRIRKADPRMDFDFDGTDYKLKGSDVTYFISGSGTKTVDYEPIFVAGNEIMSFKDAEKLYSNFPWESYKTAIANSFSQDGDHPIKPENFNVYFTISSSGEPEPHFVLDTDLSTATTETKVYDYTIGQFSKTKILEDCELTFDSAGRITTIKEPIKDASGTITGYKTHNLKATTVTDDNAYNDAYAKYEYDKYLYDKKQQEINAKTEIIQQEDRNLELKLTRLDNERKQCTTEIEAVKKVIEENIEKSYKTFSG